MSAILIYLFPTVIDMVLASVFFMTTVWAAEHGVSASGVSNLLTAWAGVYMICAYLVGRVVGKRNAAWLMIAACVATALLSAALAGAASLPVMYALVALEGVAMALFFIPFQVFMKVVGQRKQQSIPASVGLYTFSWSSGYAIGPFVAGMLWGPLGWRGCHAINGLAAIGVAIGTYLIHRHIVRSPAPVESDQSNRSLASAAADYAGKPDLAWMSWIFGGMGCIAVAAVRGIFPSSGTACGVPKFEQGLILAALSAVQALVGLSLGRGKWWMYRPLPILGFGLCGVAALVLFSISRTPAAFFIAAVCFGVYSGSFFFYFVFHSLVHPDRSGRYVSVNETVVGLTGIIGPVLAGLAADKLALWAPYLMAAGMVAVGICVQAAIHARKERW